MNDCVGDGSRMIDQNLVRKIKIGQQSVFFPHFFLLMKEWRNPRLCRGIMSCFTGPQRKSSERREISPGSRLRTSTDSLRGEMLSAATTHSALRPRRYSTRKAVIGDPPLALGIQVTYTELSVAMEMVGRSGASGTGTETSEEYVFWVVQRNRELTNHRHCSSHKGWSEFTQKAKKERRNSHHGWSGMPWRNVYLLPGLWATMLERERERRREG